METDREIKSNLKAVRLASYQACPMGRTQRVIDKLASFLTLTLGHFETLTLFSHLPQDRPIKEKTMGRYQWQADKATYSVYKPW